MRKFCGIRRLIIALSVTCACSSLFYCNSWLTRFFYQQVHTMAATQSALEERVKLVLQLRDKWPENIAVQSFDLDYYKSLSFEHKQRLLLCMKSGIETPTSQVGCYANFPDDYDVLKPFLLKFGSVPQGRPIESETLK